MRRDQFIQVAANEYNLCRKHYCHLKLSTASEALSGRALLLSWLVPLPPSDSSPRRPERSLRATLGPVSRKPVPAPGKN